MRNNFITKQQYQTQPNPNLRDLINNSEEEVKGDHVTRIIKEQSILSRIKKPNQ